MVSLRYLKLFTCKKVSQEKVVWKGTTKILHSKFYLKRPPNEKKIIAFFRGTNFVELFNRDKFKSDILLKFFSTDFHNKSPSRLHSLERKLVPVSGIVRPYPVLCRQSKI